MSVGMVGRSRAWIWIPVGVLALLGIVLVASLMFGPTAFSRGPSPWFPFFGFWAFLWIFIVFGVLRWFLWPGWGYRRGYRGGYWRGDEAVDIARSRYARGEITKEQFDEVMRGLGQPAWRQP